MSQIKAIIFDLDGTIANTLPLYIQAFRQSIEPLINRSLSDKEIIATFGPSEEGTIKVLAPQHYDEAVKSYLYFYEKLHNMCQMAFDGIEILITLKQRAYTFLWLPGKESTALPFR